MGYSNGETGKNSDMYIIWNPQLLSYTLQHLKAKIILPNSNLCDESEPLTV